MKRNTKLIPGMDDDHNIVMINKIYESFEALEETLGMLKMEKPLFITYVAKKTFADTIFNTIQKNALKKPQPEKYKN